MYAAATHQTAEDLLGFDAATSINWVPDLPTNDDAYSSLPPFLGFESDCQTSPLALTMDPVAALSWMSWMQGAGDSGFYGGIEDGNDTCLMGLTGSLTCSPVTEAGGVLDHGVLSHGVSQANLEMECGESAGESRNRKPRKRRVSSDTQDSFDSVVAEKRRRNTETARRGRARKNALIQSLETSAKELEAEKLELVERVAVLQKEADLFRMKDDLLERRVAELEERLMETLRVLLVQG
ncbi:hypothetical protein HDU98_002114 [Podochytrium sp. JEL0797]|nr:hypothetical protein HDU98_002114 [Podochytrium sp. JEL0797]